MRRSREGAWIEIHLALIGRSSINGRSREGAWIEIGLSCSPHILTQCRSREGAWIEILRGCLQTNNYCVAPVRERGLKCSQE